MASMTVSDMRAYIMHAYPNNMKWHRKVREMPTNQVIAVYYSMKERARISSDRYVGVSIINYKQSYTDRDKRVSITLTLLFFV